MHDGRWVCINSLLWKHYRVNVSINCNVYEKLIYMLLIFTVEYKGVGREYKSSTLILLQEEKWKINFTINKSDLFWNISVNINPLAVNYGRFLFCNILRFNSMLKTKE